MSTLYKAPDPLFPEIYLLHFAVFVHKQPCGWVGSLYTLPEERNFLFFFFFCLPDPASHQRAAMFLWAIKPRENDCVKWCMKGSELKEFDWLLPRSSEIKPNSGTLQNANCTTPRIETWWWWEKNKKKNSYTTLTLDTSRLASHASSAIGVRPQDTNKCWNSCRQHFFLPSSYKTRTKTHLFSKQRWIIMC